tara:strand:- start:81 stop:683 length:603 start_codon:yes stop_codon:yes gene_type:complete
MATLQDVKNAYTLGKKQSNQLMISQARQQSYGDKYVKPPVDTEKKKQQQDMKRGQFIDDGTLNEKGKPNRTLEFIKDFGPAILPLIQQLLINPQIAHSPSGTYDEHGRPRETPPWEGVDDSGNPITIPWLKEYYQQQHPNREQLHNQKYHQVSDASALTNYLKSIGQNQRTGSMRGSDLKGRKLIDALKIGKEKLDLPKV